jgi:hypothetical protein
MPLPGALVGIDEANDPALLGPQSIPLPDGSLET